MVRASFPDQTWLADVGPIPGIDAVVWNLTDPPPTDDIEVVIPNYLGAARRIGAVANVPTVRFVQLLTAGYDGILEKLPEGVDFRNRAMREGQQLWRDDAPWLMTIYMQTFEAMGPNVVGWVPHPDEHERWVDLRLA